MRLALYVLCSIYLLFVCVIFLSVAHWLTRFSRHLVSFSASHVQQSQAGRLAPELSAASEQAGGWSWDGLRKGPATSYTAPLINERTIRMHRVRIMAQLRQAAVSQQQTGEPLSRYGVPGRAAADVAATASRVHGRALLCRLWRRLNASDVTVAAQSEPFRRLGVGALLPRRPLLDAARYNTCAVVTSAGALSAARLGVFIDSHDAVVRFNGAPTRGFERQVGGATTLRVLNSRLLTTHRAELDRVTSGQGGEQGAASEALLVWDPCCYSANLSQFYARPDFPLFQPYFERRLLLPHEQFHLLSPAFVWRAWDFLRDHSSWPVPAHPPSSGFLGVLLMLSRCNWVDVVEYMPSVRQSPQCHYYDSGGSASGGRYCTVGAWHPLAAEKLLVYRLNEAGDEQVFGRGVMRLAGFRQLDCH